MMHSFAIRNSAFGIATDPACGFGPAVAGFVQSEKLGESHGGKLGEISRALAA